MLEVVSKTSCLGRVVLGTCTHSDKGLNARLLVQNRHIDLKSVVEGVDASIHRVAIDTLIALVATYGKCHKQYKRKKIKQLFHILEVLGFCIR